MNLSPTHTSHETHAGAKAAGKQHAGSKKTHVHVKRSWAKRLQFALPLAIIIGVGVGFTLNYGTGSISSLGWEDIAIICPLGAISSMLASKTFIPRAAIALIFALVFVLVFGRAFCSWVCPVPVVSKLRDAFKKGGDAAEGAGGTAGDAVDGAGAVGRAGDAGSAGAVDVQPAVLGDVQQPAEPGEGGGKHFDTRLAVLVAALLSATVFGFPVFCLICPVGLTFASLFAIITLFWHGTLNFSVVLMPCVLLLEVVFFRKWCSKICPLAALMGLIAKLNVTFRPTIDENKCIESQGGVCGTCARNCHEKIDLRPGHRAAAKSNCTRCRSCVEGCPAHAIKMPVIARRRKS